VLHTGCGEMVQTGPVSPIATKNRRPVDGMEINVVFTHELVKTDVIGVEPPLFPFRCIACGDTWVSNAGVKLGGESFFTSPCSIDRCLPRHLKETGQK